MEAGEASDLCGRVLKRGGPHRKSEKL